MEKIMIEDYATSQFKNEDDEKNEKKKEEM